MLCPLKFNSTTLDHNGWAKGCTCEGTKCALWERFTSTCSLRTQAYLLGIGAVSKDAKDESNEVQSVLSLAEDQVELQRRKIRDGDHSEDYKDGYTSAIIFYESALDDCQRKEKDGD